YFVIERRTLRRAQSGLAQTTAMIALALASLSAAPAAMPGVGRSQHMATEHTATPYAERAAIYPPFAFAPDVKSPPICGAPGGSRDGVACGDGHRTMPRFRRVVCAPQDAGAASFMLALAACPRPDDGGIDVGLRGRTRFLSPGAPAGERLHERTHAGGDRFRECGRRRGATPDCRSRRSGRMVAAVPFGGGPVAGRTGAQGQSRPASGPGGIACCAAEH